MIVEIRTRGFPITPGLRTSVERCLAFALDRYEERIARIRVTVGDVNGPKRGLDKSCRVEVRVRGARTVHAAVRSADAYAALGTAVRRAGRGVARALERERTTFVELLSLPSARSGLRSGE